MKTYILKFPVYNNIDFPLGTIIKSLEKDKENLKLNNWPYTFEVVEGKLRGEKGNIADGLNGWIIEDSLENRKKLQNFLNKKEELLKKLELLNRKWYSIKAAKID